MKITLLGTGSPIPDPNRAGSAILVQAGGLNLLFDTGRAVVMRLAAAGLFPPMLHHVLFTHLHSDHTTDYNDIITTRWAMAPVPMPLSVMGPVGTAAYTDRTLAMLSDDIGYRMEHHDDLNWQPECQVTEVSHGVVLEHGSGDDAVRITCAPTEHKPVHPTVGYRIEHGGHVVVVAGDTIPCAGLDELCAGADVYIQTAIRADQIANIPVARLQDVLDYHSSVEQAAQTASRNGVGHLVLTHPVPAPGPGAEQEWIDLARPHFAGTITLADDLTAIDL
jgi:ribonuclease Z